MALALLVTSGSPQDAATTTASSIDSPATLALVTTFADGRSTVELTSERPARTWTSAFPRVPDWQSASVAPIRAVQVARRVVDGAVEATVSVLRGSTINDEERVATVRLTLGDRIVIEELRSFGAEAIELSLATVDPSTLSTPSVTSVSGSLGIATPEPLTAPYPGYRIAVHNRSDQPVANFELRAFRGSVRALSMLQTGVHGRPVVRPGETFAFDINLTAVVAAADGRLSALGLDDIRITAVLWNDGSFEGQPEYPLMSAGLAAAAGRRLQLERAVAILRATSSSGVDARTTLRTLRAALEGLPAHDGTRLTATEDGMREERSSILDTLSRFEQSAHASELAAVRRWAAETANLYEWRARQTTPR